MKTESEHDIVISNFHYAWSTKDKEEQYKQLSKYLQLLFNSNFDSSIDYTTVNDVLIEAIEQKVRKHPVIWKLFFEV